MACKTNQSPDETQGFRLHKQVKRSNSTNRSENRSPPPLVTASGAPGDRCRMGSESGWSTTDKAFQVQLHSCFVEFTKYVELVRCPI